MRTVLIFLTLFTFYNSSAQPIVTITIETADHATVLQAEKDKRLTIAYFGKKLSSESEYQKISGQERMNNENTSMSNSVYTPAGTWNLLEPAIAVEQGDGNNSLELEYVSHDVKRESDNITLTTILLKDPVYPVEVILYYKAYLKENTIEQWSVIRNNGKKPLTLNKYASANLYFRSDKYYLRQYHGEWAQEMKPEEEALTNGIKVLDSKLGTRADLFQPPSFILSFDKKASETDGEVMMGTLAWTGNYKIEFEKDTHNHLRLVAGINPYASAYHLAAAKEFQTPEFIYTYSSTGKGEASRNMHRWARNYRIPDGNGSRLTLLNNWESTYFDFNEDKLVGLFKGAKELGVKMFLLDDGWFGNKYPRNDDRAGLGDWQENVKKLPHGLGYLVKEATNAGIKFGIWVEPEMVNPKSELYEKHKDWVIRQPQRPEYYFRNQLVLDLTNPQVQDFVFKTLDSLMIKNPGLAYIKWDCNAVMYNAHSEYLRKNNIPQSHLYVNYVNALYDILKKFKAKYPSLPMMLCSGGGARVDYGGLEYFTEYWPSDNTDPMSRIFVQWENSYFFPAIASCNHVTNWSNVSLKFKTDVAMPGKLGFDVDLDKLSPADKQFATQSVRVYDSISDIIWHGDLYRLLNPWENEKAALMFVDKDKTHAVAFNYLISTASMLHTETEPVRLQGLDPNKKYTVKEVNLYPGDKPIINSGEIFSGDFLMKHGINPVINKQRSSVVLRIDEIK